MLRSASPSASRKTSGAGSSSPVQGDVESVVVAAAILLLLSRAALWLTREATRVFFARLAGCWAVVFRPLLLEAADPAALPGLGVATFVAAIDSDLSPSAATAA